MFCLRRLAIILCFLFLFLALTWLSIPPPLFVGSCGNIVTPCSCCLGDDGSYGAASAPGVEASTCGASSPFSFAVGSCVTTSYSSDSSWMGARWGITISVNKSKGFYVVVFFLLSSVTMKFFGGEAREDEFSSSWLSSTSSRPSSWSGM